MRHPRRLALVLLTTLALLSPRLARSDDGPPPNPAIDMKGYLRVSLEAAQHRESRRLTEEQFLRMSREPGVIVLDARSKERYDELHVKGAINLAFPDIAIVSLAQTLPDKNATILIYCNNNFLNNTPVTERALASKMLTASLNLSTYIALYNYGYRNVYELGPQLDIRTTKLEFEGTLALAAERDRDVQNRPEGKALSVEQDAKLR